MACQAKNNTYVMPEIRLNGHLQDAKYIFEVYISNLYNKVNLLLAFSVNKSKLLFPLVIILGLSSSLT